MLLVACLYWFCLAFITLVFKLKFPISLFQVLPEHVGDPFPFESVVVLLATVVSLIRLCHFYLNLI